MNPMWLRCLDLLVIISTWPWNILLRFFALVSPLFSSHFCDCLFHTIVLTDSYYFRLGNCLLNTNCPYWTSWKKNLMALNFSPIKNIASSIQHCPCSFSVDSAFGPILLELFWISVAIKQSAMNSLVIWKIKTQR